jgi:hypothetical protein
MFFWFSKRSKALVALRRPKDSVTDPAELRPSPSRALTLVDIGRSMLRIKASDPEITDVELALRFDKPLDYVYTAIEAARRSYVPSTQPPGTAGG